MINVCTKAITKGSCVNINKTANDIQDKGKLIKNPITVSTTDSNRDFLSIFI